MFFIQLTCAGLTRAVGVLFVAIQKAYDSSASMVTVLGAVLSGCFSVTGTTCASAGGCRVQGGVVKVMRALSFSKQSFGSGSSGERERERERETHTHTHTHTHIHTHERTHARAHPLSVSPSLTYTCNHPFSLSLSLSLALSVSLKVLYFTEACLDRAT